MIAPRSYSNRRDPSHTAWVPPLFVFLRRSPAAPLTHVAPARAHGCGEHWTRHALHLLCSAAPVPSHCTRSVALHPFRRTAPVPSRYTRSVALHPFRRTAPDQKGCNAYGSGAPPPQQTQLRTIALRYAPGLFHEGRARGTIPVTSRYTRYVAMHPLRRDAPDQKGCNAYGSDAPPPTTSTTAKTFRLARGRAGCPSATGAALLSQFSSPGPGRPAATWRGERPRRRHPDPCRTGHLR